MEIEAEFKAFIGRGWTLEMGSWIFSICKQKLDCIFFGMNEFCLLLDVFDDVV